MSCTRLRIAVTILALVSILLPFQHVAFSSPSAHTTVITVNRKGNSQECKIGSQSFGANLLAAYNNVLEKHGSDAPVAVLIDDTLPANLIWVAPALAPKVPLTNVRVFVVYREGGRMFETKSGPFAPVGTPIEEYPTTLRTHQEEDGK